MYPDGRRFRSYSSYFKSLFGQRLQKVTINAGFTCPNRDGKVGTGGCTYCNNEAFSPSYCMRGGDVKTQILQGMEFHEARYRRADNFLAYFQSFSNTYAPLDKLKEIYNSALSLPRVKGIIVGTRPDCVDEQKLDYFASLAEKYYVAIEYGIESCYDKTLRTINRGHDFECAKRAVKMTAERGIHTGAHFILGLPGESEKMLLEQCDMINSLPLESIKFHQLQIFKDTQMERDYLENPDFFHFWGVEQYIELFSEILISLRDDIIVERFASEAPPRFLVSPSWGKIRNDELWRMLEKKLEKDNLCQGMLYKK
ncbi:MAG: TIGR01212 family radical SAM protein [Rikenellaceae bacterium]